MDVVGISHEEQALEDSLCKRVTVTRNETITKWLDPEAAAVSRDVLTKVVYSGLFEWTPEVRNIHGDLRTNNIMWQLNSEVSTLA
ncbi:hypothetical protein Vadar_017227 [Vaccinium darrowii]|uniref:Uncharacterized protein n=1 Tax=Vaccinium darrowii TaxID=229202 RepID=A0ACB7YMM0_9ERIC|nr:hypothetical protein Vadar_017227 [Vaccinium darrowii]